MSDGFDGAALNFLEREFGGPVEEREDTFTTGATPIPSVGNDPEALSCVFFNLGANAVYLALDGRASATRGIYLAANGGSVSLTVRDDGTLPGREWWATSPGGASTLYALRIRRRAFAPGT